MSNSVVRLWILVLTLLLGGCSLLVPRSPAPELLLLPPQEGPPAQLLKQRVTMQYDNREQQFLAVVRWERASIRVAVLAPTGQTLLGLVYDGKVLEQHASLRETVLPIREMLALMQFAHWPSESLRRHYSTDLGWQLQITGQHRQLLWQRRPVVSLNSSGAIRRISQLNAGYRLQIETLEKQLL